MLLLFDIDATLLRTKGGIGRRVLCDAFAHAFSVAPHEHLGSYSFAGKTDRQIALDVASFVGVDSPTVENGFERYQQILEIMMLEEIVPATVEVLPGVFDLLRALQNSRNCSALVTGNIRRVAFHKLAVGGIDTFFDTGAFGCEHADRSLLPPLAIERANARYGRQYVARNTVVVGDAPGDVVCAHRNGIACIGVATGEFSIEALAAVGADAVLPSLLDTDAFVNILNELERRLPL